MKITLNGIDFYLNNCSEKFPIKFQEEIDQIFVTAGLCDYFVSYGYNVFSKTLHCYFKKNQLPRFTLSFYHNEKQEFVKYSILIWKNRNTIYRKRNSSSFFKVLKNFRKIIL
ncbi:hypothetical protein D3C87_76750 [compost metagenome]